MTRASTKDVLMQPAYTYAEAARFLAVPNSTVHSWVTGRPHFKRVVTPATRGGLSFTNLVELHVLSALRSKGVRMPHIRKALAILGRELDSKHPLADGGFFTAGPALFVRHLGKLAQISTDVQLVIQQALEQYISRVDRNPDGVPIRLYPTILHKPDARVVVIDPAVAFGRPVLVGVGIPTTEIAQRFDAGDDLDFLAKDLGVTVAALSDVVRFEHRRAA
jgi:uncharacterized protein (DUF433 family)